MRLLCLLFAVSLIQFSHAETDHVARQDNLVIVLSWDGMRHDYPERGHYPALRRLENEGVRAGRGEPVLSECEEELAELPRGPSGDRRGRYAAPEHGVPGEWPDCVDPGDGRRPFLVHLALLELRGQRLACA